MANVLFTKHGVEGWGEYAAAPWPDNIKDLSDQVGEGSERKKEKRQGTAQVLTRQLLPPP